MPLSNIWSHGHEVFSLAVRKHPCCICICLSRHIYHNRWTPQSKQLRLKKYKVVNDIFSTFWNVALNQHLRTSLIWSHHNSGIEFYISILRIHSWAILAPSYPSYVNKKKEYQSNQNELPVMIFNLFSFNANCLRQPSEPWVFRPSSWTTVSQAFISKDYRVIRWNGHCNNFLAIVSILRLSWLVTEEQGIPKFS